MAKTFTDSKGNIRLVGSGKLVRKTKPTPKKAPSADVVSAYRDTNTPMPKKGALSYLDSQGTLRLTHGRVDVNGLRPAVNAMDRRVDAVISQQTAPYTNQRKTADQDMQRAAGQIQELGAFLQKQGLEYHNAALEARRQADKQYASDSVGAQQAIQDISNGATKNAENLDMNNDGQRLVAITPDYDGVGKVRASDNAIRNLQASSAAEGLSLSSQAQSDASAALSSARTAHEKRVQGIEDAIAQILASRNTTRNDLVNQSLNEQGARLANRLSGQTLGFNAQTQASNMAATDLAARQAAKDLAGDSGSGSGLGAPAAPKTNPYGASLTDNQKLQVNQIDDGFVLGSRNKKTGVTVKTSAKSYLYLLLRAYGMKNRDAAFSHWVNNAGGAKAVKKLFKTQQAFVNAMKGKISDAHLNRVVSNVYGNKKSASTRPVTTGDLLGNAVTSNDLINKPLG